MPLRLAKLTLTASVALLLALVAFNNISDYQSNFAFVAHVLSMDTTFRHDSVMWRALEAPALHHAAYLVIIGCELTAAAGCFVATLRFARALNAHGAVFGAAERPAVLSLTLSMILWLTGFLVVGGEWFHMWQSADWNGQASAFRMFAISAIALLVVIQPEASSHR